MASSVIYYSTEAQKKNLFVLYYNRVGKNAKTREINYTVAKLDTPSVDVSVRVYFNNTQLATNENAE